MYKKTMTIKGNKRKLITIPLYYNIVHEQENNDN